MTIDWNYDNGYVDVSMPGYVQKSLQRLQYQPKISPQYSPHKHTPFFIAAKGTQQLTSPPDNTSLLSPQETTYIQSVAGTFLYYARVIDSTLLPALNELASQQA